MCKSLVTISINTGGSTSLCCIIKNHLFRVLGATSILEKYDKLPCKAYFRVEIQSRNTIKQCIIFIKHPLAMGWDQKFHVCPPPLKKNPVFIRLFHFPTTQKTSVINIQIILNTLLNLNIFITDTARSCVCYVIVDKTHRPKLREKMGKKHRSFRIYAPKKCSNSPEFGLVHIKYSKNLAIHIDRFKNESNIHPIYSYMKFINLTVMHKLPIRSLLSGRNTQKYCI